MAIDSSAVLKIHPSSKINPHQSSFASKLITIHKSSTITSQTHPTYPPASPSRAFCLEGVNLLPDQRPSIWSHSGSHGTCRWEELGVSCLGNSAANWAGQFQLGVIHNQRFVSFGWVRGGFWLLWW